MHANSTTSHAVTLNPLVTLATCLSPLWIHDAEAAAATDPHSTHGQGHCRVACRDHQWPRSPKAKISSSGHVVTFDPFVDVVINVLFSSIYTPHDMSPKPTTESFPLVATDSSDGLDVPSHASSSRSRGGSHEPPRPASRTSHLRSLVGSRAASRAGSTNGSPDLGYDLDLESGSYPPSRGSSRNDSVCALPPGG
jgi:hypothetical protein